MNLKKTIFFSYTAYTIYIILLIGSTNMRFLETFPVLLFIWVNYTFFTIGYRHRRQKITAKSKKTWLSTQKKSGLLILAIVSVTSAIMAVRYYTGQTPIDVLINLNKDVSTYYEYQFYFNEQQRHIFSISKIPFILMLFYIKVILLYSYISFLIEKGNIYIYQKIYLLLITFSYLYVGLARGTSFELFELLILIIYIILSRMKNQTTIKIKPMIFILVLIIIGIYMFNAGISSRGYEYNIYQKNSDINYSPDGWLSKSIPFISILTFKIYGYFGFGTFYISRYLSEIWFESMWTFILGLFPLGIQLYSGNNIRVIMRRIVDVGVKWHPDFVIFSNNLGYLGLLFFCILLGFIAKYSYIREPEKPVLHLTNYMILLQMISLPIGNFVMASSANKLLVVSLSLYWAWRILINRKLRL